MERERAVSTMGHSTRIVDQPQRIHHEAALRRLGRSLVARAHARPLLGHVGANDPRHDLYDRTTPITPMMYVIP